MVEPWSVIATRSVAALAGINFLIVTTAFRTPHDRFDLSEDAFRLGVCVVSPVRNAPVAIQQKFRAVFQSPTQSRVWLRKERFSARLMCRSQQRWIVLTDSGAFLKCASRIANIQNNALAEYGTETDCSLSKEEINDEETYKARPSEGARKAEPR